MKRLGIGLSFLERIAYLALFFAVIRSAIIWDLAVDRKLLFLFLAGLPSLFFVVASSILPIIKTPAKERKPFSELYLKFDVSKQNFINLEGKRKIMILFFCPLVGIGCLISLLYNISTTGEQPLILMVKAMVFVQTYRLFSYAVKQLAMLSQTTL